jgi:hypothetical protein
VFREASRGAGPEEDATAISRQGWIALGAGLGLALAIFLIPLTRFVLGYLGILVHELGHTLLSWLFGYPALPAFDFLYGGGFTPTWERSYVLLAGVLALVGWLFYAYRRNRATLAALALATALLALAAFTPIHQFVILFAGHGSELVFAGIFLFRAIKGSAIKTPAERPLYACVGFFILLTNLALAHGLITSEESRMAYEEAKGGGAWMDFSQISADFLHVSLPTAALLFLPLIVLTPVLAWLAFRHEEALRRLLARLLVREP